MPRIHFVKQQPEERFSGVELRVQAFAGRRARRQLLGVPWRVFRRAYEQYPQWQGLVLWSHTIMTAEGRAASEVLRTLRERCPGFVGREISASDLSVRLLEWIHDRRLGYAKQQGWLDALAFYGVRHLRSQAAWACWERCESKENQAQPKTLLPFDEWWRRTVEAKLCGDLSYGELATTIQRCIDWKAVTMWLRPLFARNVVLPGNVAAELNRRCAGILGCRDFGADQHGREKRKTWRQINKLVSDHCLSPARRGGWLSTLLQQVRSHPEHIHIVNYGKHWANENRPPHYPSFRDWRQNADCYIEEPRRKAKQLTSRYQKNQT
jgi:hypothetical protein